MPASTVTSIKSEPSISSMPNLGRKRNRLWSFFELIGLLIIAVFALEWFFNLCDIGQGEFLEPNLIYGSQHIPNKLVVWRLEGYSRDRLSSVGLRDIEHSIPKPAGVKRIALLGDSSTEGLQVPFLDTYGYVLQTLLNKKAQKGIKYEVINFACSGYSTGQESMQYDQQVAQYKPDVVLLLYNCGDAVENVLEPIARHVAQPRPYYYLDSNGTLKEDPSILQANIDKLRPNKVMDFLRANSRIFGVLSQTNLSLSINEPLYRKVTAWFSKYVHIGQSIEAANAKPVYYSTQDPVKVTTTLLSQLNDKVKANGSRFVVAMFPNRNQDPDYARQETAVLALSKQKGFDCIDFTDAFVKRPDTNSLFLLYHFSSTGHKLAAEEILPVINSEIPGACNAPLQ